MKISLLAALLLFTFGASLAQNRYIIKENNEGKLTYVLVNTKGEELKRFIDFSEIETSGGITLAVDNKIGKTGYLDNNGDWLIPPTYSAIWFSNFNNGYAVVYAMDKKVERSAVINLKNEVVIPFEERILSLYNDAWFAYSADKGHEKGYINLKNEKMKGIEFEKCNSFCEGKAAITDKKGKSYYINTKGKPLKRYTGKGESNILFSEGLAATTKGYINENGLLDIDIDYKYWRQEQPFANGVAVILVFDTEDEETGVYHLINKKGETLWQSENIKM